MNAPQARRPFPLPGDLPAPDPLKSWSRAILAAAKGVLEHEEPAKISQRLWPRDANVPVILRAATAPATTTTSGWASQLVVPTSVGLVQALGRGSAAAQLAQLGLVVTTNSPVTVPALSFGTSLAFVLEGGPIPAFAGTTNAITLTPKKIAGIVALTRQVVEGSNPSAVDLISQVLTEHIAARLDTLMLDAVAGSATRPAGLRNGISAITATAGGGEQAMFADIGNLANAVTAVSGGEIAIIAAPAQWAALMLKAGSPPPFPILYSAGLADGDVIAVALPALVMAMDEAPKIATSGDAVLVMDDVAPTQLAVGAQGAGVVGSPAISLFQVDAIGVRIIWRATWGLRAAGGLAWTTAATWG